MEQTTADVPQSSILVPELLFSWFWLVVCTGFFDLRLASYLWLFEGGCGLADRSKSV